MVKGFPESLRREALQMSRRQLSTATDMSASLNYKKETKRLQDKTTTTTMHLSEQPLLENEMKNYVYKYVEYTVYCMALYHGKYPKDPTYYSL